MATLRPVITGYDATSANEHLLPVNVLVAGYSTQVGTFPAIKWTPNQWARHTKPYPALRIDQDPGATDYSADYLDVEAGAATDDDIVRWITNARISFNAWLRLDQRWPGLYCSRSSVDAAVVVLQRASIRNVPFIVADYSLTAGEAVSLVQTAAGDYPQRGAQYNTAFGGAADTDIWDQEWVSTMSGMIVTPPPPTTVKDQDMVILSLKDSSGNTVTYTFDGHYANHIVSSVDQEAFAKVLPVIPVTLGQFTEITGGAPV